MDSSISFSEYRIYRVNDYYKWNHHRHANHEYRLLDYYAFVSAENGYDETSGNPFFISKFCCEKWRILLGL